jgi:endosialidase-like protein
VKTNQTKEKPKQRTKFETAGRTERKCMNQFIHVISRKISSARGLIRCSQLACVFLLVPLLLACFALSRTAQAVSPPPDGGYPGFNTAEGENALLNLTTGGYNTAVGWFSLSAATTGNFNTGLGAGTLSATTASEDTATGAGALFRNTTGSNNTATGTFALFNNTSGTWNTVSGSRAMVSNDTGSYNDAFGGYALASNVDGAFNSAFGESALSQNISGINNTAVGQGALENNDYTGAGMANFNTAVGAHALGNIDGAANTAIGESAFGDNLSGSHNTVVGWHAGAGVEGNDNIYIGATSGLPGGGSEDETIRIGDPNFVSACFIAGISGQTASGGVGVFINGNGKLGTLTSSARFKEDIKPMDEASELIFSLKPVTFRYKKAIDASGIPQFGLVAEHVAKVNPDLVVLDKEGKPYTVRYEAVNAMLLNEFLKEHRQVQAQERTLREQDAMIAELRNGLQSVVAQLKEQDSKIQRVSARLATASPSSGGLELQTAPAQTVANSR